MQLNQSWVKYSFLGLLYALSFNLLWIASTGLELIPNVVSWYLPAGLRICVFLFAPYRSWPFLIIFERAAFYILFQNDGLLAAPYHYAESFAWYLTHFVVHPSIFLLLIWQYRKRYDGQLLQSLASSAALIGLSTATSLVNAMLFVGRKMFESEAIADSAISHVMNMAIGDLVGILVIFPIVILAKEMLTHWDDKTISMVTQSSTIWTIILCFYFFITERSDGYDYYVKVLAIMPAIFFSLRYGNIGAMCSVFFLCAMTYMAALLNHGPTLENQFYMIATSMCCMFIGAAINEQRASQASLKLLNVNLSNANRTISQSLMQNRLLATKLIDSQEAERKRLSMDLHDDFGQKIVEIKIGASLLKRQLPEGAEQIDSLIATTDNLYASLKSSIGGLSPSGLDEFGLAEILKVGDVRQLIESNYLSYSANINGDDSVLTERQRINLYRVYQESVNNSLKYAKANHIHVVLDCSDKGIFFKVADNGIGFNVDKADKGFGLISMAERASALDAKYSISSTKTGTAVELAISLET